MFRLEGGRPNDERGFIHKSKFGKFIGGAVKQIVPIVGPATQAISFAKQVFAKQPARRIAPRSTTARPTVQGQQGKALGRSFKFGVNGAVHPAVAPGALVRTAAAPCFPGFTRDPRSGRCTPIAVTLARKVGEIIVGGGAGASVEMDPESGPRAPVGEALMGRYGAALEPGSMIIDRAVCLPGMQLGNDGLCYNKGQISNKQRMWPAGRRPLLTGGDMRALSIAARAARRMEATTKRLQKMGMLKKPAPRRALPAGHVARLRHASEH